MSQAPLHLVTGQSFQDRDGQRWWVKGPRPGSGNQFLIEAEMKGNYPRVAVYTMTEPEFRERARLVELKPAHPTAVRRTRPH